MDLAFDEVLLHFMILAMKVLGEMCPDLLAASCLTYWWIEGMFGALLYFYNAHYLLRT